MELSNFKRILNGLEYSLTNNRRNFDMAIASERSKGNNCDLRKVMRVIQNYKNIDENVKKENQKIAVCYAGQLEITITYILDSILYGNNVTLCISENKIINEALVSTVLDCMRKNMIGNEWVNYEPTFSELYLRDNSKYIDKIVYVGDYYEYLKLKSFVKTNVEYNNYGYIKLYIDKEKFGTEYSDITNFARRENIFIEAYTDEEDFISESKDVDYSIIFADMSVVNKIKRELKCGELLINAFPYNNYEFKVNR